ncbi:MAG: hypothetical protein KKB70_06215 [Proteobacteria bacterium]|nr:hypothetical protein [Pseudomonadota bacterium]
MAQRRKKTTKYAGTQITLTSIAMPGREVIQGTIYDTKGGALKVMVDGLVYPVRIGGPKGYLPLSVGQPKMDGKIKLVAREVGRMEVEAQAETKKCIDCDTTSDEDEFEFDLLDEPETAKRGPGRPAQGPTDDSLYGEFIQNELDEMGIELRDLLPRGGGDRGYGYFSFEQAADY